MTLRDASRTAGVLVLLVASIWGFSDLLQQLKFRALHDEPQSVVGWAGILDFAAVPFAVAFLGALATESSKRVLCTTLVLAVAIARLTPSLLDPHRVNWLHDDPVGFCSGLVAQSAIAVIGALVGLRAASRNPKRV